MVSRNCNRQTRYDQSFRDRRSHAGHRRGKGRRGNPGLFLFRVRLQISASRATISRDLIVRTVLRLYSAPKRLLRFAWLPLRHNARCVIFVVENKPLFHFAVAFRTLIVSFHHLPLGPIISHVAVTRLSNRSCRPLGQLPLEAGCRECKCSPTQFALEGLVSTLASLRLPSVASGRCGARIPNDSACAD